ncbi:hypothetical protein ACA910_003677 [Epithemia clementina (nom. ined.)]
MKLVKLLLLVVVVAVVFDAKCSTNAFLTPLQLQHHNHHHHHQQHRNLQQQRRQRQEQQQVQPKKNSNLYASPKTTLLPRHLQQQKQQQQQQHPQQRGGHFFPTGVPSSVLLWTLHEKSDSLRDPPKDDTDTNSSSLPWWLDVGTKGGAVVLSIVLFLIPMVAYQLTVSVIAPNADPLQVGQTIGVGFTVILTLAWVSTYIFRVANKEMTYAQQLKDYEDGVIAKRLEELDEDEILALVEEVENDPF